VKRLPLATLLGVLCFALLSIFTQYRASADHTTGPDQTRSNKTMVNADGTITTVSDETGKGEFVPGEMLVKFRNRTLPLVAITTPANNAFVAGSAVAVSASASDNIALSRVDFYRDSNVLLGTDNTAPYGISWDTMSLTGGAHTLIAVATNLAGNTKTSTVVNVTVDSTPPQVSLSAPANGAFVTGTPAVSAVATDNIGISKVEFYIDNNVLLTTDTNSPYGFNWNSTTVPDGAHTLYAIAQDTFGLRTTSASVAITVDNTAPTVAITSPANGATVSRNTTVNINANASDNIGVVKVEFYVGTTLTCTDTAAPYTCAWQVPNPKATFSLKATVYDVAGKTTTHSISVSSK